eukprot:m.383450 g.383450  ORF g.383450 m.383450 type:complete len:62 (+) comp127843_c0_seq1:49-234(+)
MVIVPAQSVSLQWWVLMFVDVCLGHIMCSHVSVGFYLLIYFIIYLFIDDVNVCLVLCVDVQ